MQCYRIRISNGDEIVIVPDAARVAAGDATVYRESEIWLMDSLNRAEAMFLHEAKKRFNAIITQRKEGSINEV